MKIKLDENIPHRLTELLEQMGHDGDTVFDEGLNSKSDEEIWEDVESWKRCFVVITDRKLRVRRPPSS